MPAPNCLFCFVVLTEKRGFINKSKCTFALFSPLQLSLSVQLRTTSDDFMQIWLKKHTYFTVSFLSLFRLQPSWGKEQYPHPWIQFQIYDTHTQPRHGCEYRLPTLHYTMLHMGQHLKEQYIADQPRNDFLTVRFRFTLVCELESCSLLLLSFIEVFCLEGCR